MHALQNEDKKNGRKMLQTTHKWKMHANTQSNIYNKFKQVQRSQLHFKAKEVTLGKELMATKNLLFFTGKLFTVDASRFTACLITTRTVPVA